MFRRTMLNLCVIFLFASPVFSQSNTEIVFWESVRDSNSVKRLELYIETYPNGAFRQLAEFAVEDIEGANTQALEDCDRLAGHPDDITLATKAVAYSDLEKNPALAIAACLIASKDDNPRYTFQLARSYSASGSDDKALPYYEDAAQRGHIRANYRLGIVYMDADYGVAQDMDKAVSYLLIAAEGGTANASFQLGWVFQTGKNGVAVDYERAMQHYQKGEAGGENNVFYPLGWMYEHGNGVLFNLKLAKDYYRKSAKAKSFRHVDGQLRLAEMLMRELSFWDVYSYEPNRDVALEALAVLRNRSGKTKKYHDQYVTKILDIFQGATETFYRFEIGDSPSDTYKTTQVNMADMASISMDHLGEALDARYRLFPDDYPNQSPSEVKALVANIGKDGQRFMKSMFDIDQFAIYAVTHPADDCIATNDEWPSDNSAYRFNVTNHCDYDVQVKVRLRIKYDDGSRADKVSIESRNIKAFDFAWFSVFPDTSYSGGKHGYSGALVCFARLGFVEFDWNADSYSCVNPINWAKRLQGQVGEVFSARLTGMRNHK